MQNDSVNVHYTPGRMRVRCPLLKADHRRARSAQSRVAGIQGVDSVEWNTLTGSLLICFDERRSTREQVLQAVSTGAKEYHTMPAEVAVRSSVLPSGATGTVAKAVGTYAGEKLVGHLFTVLIAVVL